MKKLQEINNYIESKLKGIRTNRDEITKQLDLISIDNIISNLDTERFIEDPNGKRFSCWDVYDYTDDTLPKMIEEITLYGPSSNYCQKINSEGVQKGVNPHPITLKIFYKIQDIVLINKQKTIRGSEVRELYFKVRGVPDEQIQAYSKVAKKEGY